MCRTSSSRAARRILSAIAVKNSYAGQFHTSSGSLCPMPLQGPINTHFVLERDEFRKASTLVLRNLPRKIKWAGYVQCGLLVALMLTGVAFRPGGELQPVSLGILILVWLVFVTGRIAHRAIKNFNSPGRKGRRFGTNSTTRASVVACQTRNRGWAGPQFLDLSKRTRCSSFWNQKFCISQSRNERLQRMTSAPYGSCLWRMCLPGRRWRNHRRYTR
jgi:hypothetical protein